MNPAPEASGDPEFLNRALEITIRIGVVLVLAAWCVQIMRPFLIPVLWGIIIAVAVFPAYQWLVSALNGRPRLAALCVSLVLFVILIIPTVMLADTLVNTVRALAAKLQAGTLEVPPPPASVVSWPLIGEPLNTFWRAASENLALALKPITPQLKAFGAWLLAGAAQAGLGILQFLAAIIISGMLLAYTKLGSWTARTLGIRLAGEQGTDYIDVAEATVRSVARGILGVALIQSLLAGLGFLLVGIPGAGLWAFIALFLSVIQIGVTPVTLPMVIYVFATFDTGTAIIFLVWNIFVSAIDNILKPVLLGRGVEVPLLVIFAGSIGGFISLGIIGLFTGAVVLALGYKLFVAWLDGTVKPVQPQEQAESDPSASIVESR
jgi:predicted PurR-regulated permease PerM